MLILVGLLFGGIFIYQIGKYLLIQHMLRAASMPSSTVSAIRAGYRLWQPQLEAVGNVRAINGVDVTTEIAGMVQKITFTPGMPIKAGDTLVQLNADTDLALLASLQAKAHAAKTIYERDRAQLAAKAVSVATVDADRDQLDDLNAQVAQQKATVAKKTITAPFSGNLGISLVNVGQYLNPGIKIVSLQSLDPIYVDFYLPQQQLRHLKQGLKVILTTDAFPNQTFTGTITALDPAVDTQTRNLLVEATVANPQFKLHPGMFVHVVIEYANEQRYLTLPQSAISFNSYGQMVYLIKEINSSKQKKPQLIAVQSFVKTGETRGDQIRILSGVQAGDLVVSSGQIKLKNRAPVVINNDVVPLNNPVSQYRNE